MSELDDLTFRTFGPIGSDEPDDVRVRGFAEAVSRGFLEGRGGEERLRRWREHLRADRVTLRGAWEDPTPYAAGTMPVATTMSFDKTVNVGAGRTLALHMITDVTVSPVHRRRGLTRRLLGEDLADAAARGLPLAGLTVSEGSIYGRFGFGPATHLRQVEVDTGPRFALRPDVTTRLGADPGRMLLLEPSEAWPAVQEVWAGHHAATRGSVARPQFYEPMLTGAFSVSAGAPDEKLRAVVHLDADGRPDGYALYRPAGEVDGVKTVDVEDLATTATTAEPDPGATYLRLWRFLAQMDLIGRIRWRRARMVEPIEHALVEPRVVRTTGISDLLWIRLLDVVTALEARPWYADGEVVLDVEDPLGHATGRWRVAVRDGVARVRPSTDPPEVRLLADTLGSLYLGGVTVGTLAAAGRVDGEPDAVGRLAALADGGPAPWCTTGF